MNRAEMQDKIRKFIIDEYIDDEDEAEDVDATTALIGSGLIDSFSIVAIRNWLEKTYDVKIPDELGTKDNFASIDTIIDLVEQQKG